MHKRMLLPLAVALSSSAASAANSVDLAVTGRIMPAACSISLSSSEYAFGEIKSSDLNIDSNTAGRTTDHDLGIICSTPTHIAIQATDNRSGTALDTHFSLFGLGLDSQGNSIGAYQLITMDTELDGSLGYGTRSDDGGATWNYDTNVLSTAPSSIFSWNKTANGANPEPFVSLTQVLRAHLILSPMEDLDITQEIPLDGSATLELFYL
ncbi:DUF1120 domain-containing protein [Pseudomonas resinovorans]|uniref:DUF1120 domain-containing protein n=1 Tax=Metapseudomonas resinovorans TaxID=53412 RepID=A0ABT4YA14_METRE|nr:DUF1120 domain-containing protein [Pseudomonas resinovorans]MDA8485720.1 DUF1120 domain-containing protein [Pseudomonas resinovorans]